MNWLSDNWKSLFDGAGGTAAVALVGYVLKRWFDSRKQPTGEQKNATSKVENSSLFNSPAVSGSQNIQTVIAPTIHAHNLNYTSTVSAPSPSDPRRKSSRFIVGVAVGGVLMIVVLPFLFTLKIPGALKSGPVVDEHGHPNPSDANRDELAVRDLQDDISDLIEYKDRVPYSDYNRRHLKDAAYLAGRMLAINDAKLRLRYRYVKYEYAAFALEMAAVFVTSDSHAKTAEYATDAINIAETALRMLKQKEEPYQSDEEMKVLLDWVNKEELGKDRALYVKADAECLLGKVKNDPTLKSQALETWNQISLVYRSDFPAKGTPELSGCVPTTTSD